jgi:pimeloyl-ACP methyl ester carboxylesterase
MPPVRVVFIHGVATTHRVWDRVLPHFEGYEISCPERPASGDLDVEIAALSELCSGAVVVGVSGGATLGMELATGRRRVLRRDAAGAGFP